MIKETNKLTGKLNASIIHVYPELEDITITPQLEEQVLKSEKYGFDDIVVKGIPATDLKIEPSFEEQVEEGIFKKVEVGAIPQQTLDIVPTEEEQTETGIFTEVNIGAIQAVEIAPELNFDATNSIVLQGQDGTYMKKVTLNKDKNLTSDNIKTGVTIFGVEGGVADTSDATATANDLVVGTTAYVNNQKVTGTIPDNGILEFEPSDNEQEIPSGLTTGGVVKAADITTLNEYNACLTLANSIEVFDDYTETTATPEDLVKGKTAYSNGEKIVGTLEIVESEYNSFIQETLGAGNSSGGYNTSTNLYKIITKIPDNLVLSGTNGTNMFRDCWALEKIPENIDTSNITNMTYMFGDCRAIKEIPLLNTSKATNMQGTFYNCQMLEYIPELDTTNNGGSNLSMNSTFKNCPNLTDESLNNILAMCIKAIKFTNATYKTLAYIGLTSDQATRCQSLSNYQAFLNAGWTTGY